MEERNMLNPCDPCVCPGAPCEQCSFGYRSREDNHERMKKLLISVDAGEKPFGWMHAELYKQFHSDWRNKLGETAEKVEAETTNEKCNGCDLYKNGLCTKWDKDGQEPDPSTIGWFTDTYADKHKFVEIDRMCRETSIFGNCFIRLTQSDIDRLKNGEIAYIRHEYGTFIGFVEEAQNG